MATPVTQPLGGGDDGLVTASFTYDVSVTPPLVTTVTVVNDDTGSVPVTAVIMDATTHAVLWSRTVQAKTGTVNHDVSGLGVHMVSRTARDGSTYWGLPFIIGMQIG